MYKLTLKQEHLISYQDENGTEKSYTNDHYIELDCSDMKGVFDIIRDLEGIKNMDRIEISVSKTEDGEIDVL